MREALQLRDVGRNGAGHEVETNVEVEELVETPKLGWNGARDSGALDIELLQIDEVADRRREVVVVVVAAEEEFGQVRETPHAIGNRAGQQVVVEMQHGEPREVGDVGRDGAR